MSINATANAALARRPDFEPANAVPRGYAEIAAAAATPAKPIDGQAAIAPNGSGVFQTLTTYIPTEILTLYVSAVAALGPVKITIGNEVHHFGRWAPFWVCLVATPALVWLAFATKVKTSGKPIPVEVRKWPQWEMAAATIAYFAWTFALPNTPFSHFEWYSSGLASFLVLVVSSGLGAIAPLMQRTLPV